MKPQRKNKRMIALAAVTLGLVGLATGCSNDMVTRPAAQEVSEIPPSVTDVVGTPPLEPAQSGDPSEREIADRYGRCDPKKEFKWDIPGNVEL